MDEIRSVDDVFIPADSSGDCLKRGSEMIIWFNVLVRLSITFGHDNARS